MTEEKKSGLTKAILLAGLLAGTADALGATVHFLSVGGKEPLRIWNYVASGVFGAEALTGGSTMTVLGLFFHYCIATTWAFVYFKAFPQIKLLRKNLILSAVLYGTFVWLCMNRIVLPLSNVNQGSFRIDRAIVAAMILMICIGLPIAYRAKNYYKGLN